MFKSRTAVLIAMMLMVFSASARADGIDDDVLQKILGKGGNAANLNIKPIKEDDALRLTSNKDKILRLDQDAASVIVNNPAHATVLLDSPRLLIIMPREPGATSFKVLNADGTVILQKDIIVTNAQPKYVRIRRMCSGGAGCVPEAYFYCPDGCYEVTPVAGGNGAIGIPPPIGGGHKSSDAGDLNGGEQQLQPPENPVHATTMPATPLSP